MTRVAVRRSDKHVSWRASGASSILVSFHVWQNVPTQYLRTFLFCLIELLYLNQAELCFPMELTWLGIKLITDPDWRLRSTAVASLSGLPCPPSCPGLAMGLWCRQSEESQGLQGWLPASSFLPKSCCLPFITSLESKSLSQSNFCPAPQALLAISTLGLLSCVCLWSSFLGVY